MEPFVELTAAVTAAFPQYPPYEGAFDEVIPHVCVGREAPKLLMQAAGWLVKGRLPITGTVNEVWLMTIGDPQPFYGVRHAFALRGHPDATYGTTRSPEGAPGLQRRAKRFSGTVGIRLIVGGPHAMAKSHSLVCSAWRSDLRPPPTSSQHAARRGL